ncbi:MAG TPA: hypothetical protein VFY26_07690 [Anaerolineales bacterium]|nr:hypothetical protein [Anaerolineales bacterium]
MANLDAFQPREDGQLLIAIREEEVTVAPEGRTRIHVGLINEGLTGENVTLSVQGVPAEWTTLDTPVVFLAPGEARQVILTLQPPAMPTVRVGHYSLEVRAVSQSDPRRSDTAQCVVTVAAYQSRGRIEILLGSVEFSAVPGSSVEIPILLHNHETVEDSIRLGVAGLPADWISTNTALTRLSSSASEEILLTIQVPRSPDAVAGRIPFTLHFASELFPTQTTAVDCSLTILPFSEFSAAIEPDRLQAGRYVNLVIANEGNTTDTYTLHFHSPENALFFEKAVQVSRPGIEPGTQEIEILNVEIPQAEQLQVAAGERAVYPFRAKLGARPLFGNEREYPFTVDIRTAENRSREISGLVREAGYLPAWLVAVAALSCMILCFALLVPLSGFQRTARATQTASFNQTQAALSGQSDTDGDGLTNERENSLGTDPLLADTDADGLQDRDEVDTFRTNPLDADTDEDGLLDGAEVLTHSTDPLNPDTDGDGLSDGDEISRATDPRNRDTDNDGLPDGEEVRLGTDPRKADTDDDGLLDSQENPTCPRPLDPDSDGDGLLDGADRDPCNASNPALTATAISGAPTIAPPILPSPTQPLPTQPIPTSTPPAPSLEGLMLFATDRDGNFEIYVQNLADLAQTRLTNSQFQDTQPALSPDSSQFVFVSNRDGNNEIYIRTIANQAPVNLTNQGADDQQPAWSADGNWIAFTTNRDGNQEIYIMNRNGSDVRNLTGHPASDSAPTWFTSGSEQWIAFTTNRDGNQEIYKVRPDGSGLANLTLNPANDHSPSGSVGTLLAFVSERDGNSEIYTITDTGGAPTNITNHPAQDLDPALQPGAQWISFTSDRDGQLEIYVVPVTGGAAYNLTRNASQDSQPDW